jgi:LysM repeat protein
MKLVEPLYVGRLLKIREQEKDKKERTENLKNAGTPVSRSSKISTYKVRKGDTLTKIAVKYDITLNSLMKLNHMKLDEPLYANRTLRLP